MVSADEARSGIRFGPFWLMPGITRINALTLFYSTFANVLMITFLNFVQPYLLNDVLKVPADQQGSFTGALGTLQELISLVLFGLVGTLSDRVGRRNLCALGLLLQAIGLALVPIADAGIQLFLYRAIFAAGVATASVTILAAFQDYPQDRSRGKWSGINSIATSLAILVLALVGVRLPQFFQAGGADPVTAGRLSFWTAAIFGVVSAAVVWAGYNPGKGSSSSAPQSIFSALAETLREARRNPRLALACSCAFASRGDMMVLGAFLSVWYIRSGAEQGISSVNALAKVGIAMGVFQVVLMVGAPLVGWLVDRVDRVKAVCIAMALAAAGYFAVGRVANPYELGFMLPAMALLALGEIGAIITGNTLLGQESPARLRGSTSGAYNFCGTLGVLFATGLGGIAFDRIAYSMPFTMMAVVNLLVMLFAVSIAVRSRKPAPA